MAKRAAFNLFGVILVIGAGVFFVAGARGYSAREAKDRERVGAAQELMSRHGCPTCHSLPELRSANSTVGPPLEALGRRVYVGGRLNTEQNLTEFLKNPSAERPSTMPDVGLSVSEARQIAVYLRNLR